MVFLVQRSRCRHYRKQRIVEVRSLNLLKKGRLYLPLFIAALLALTGCAPRGATTNQGWTVVAATDGAVYAVLPAGRVIALDAATGDELWSYPIGTEQGGRSEEHTSE